MPADFVKEKNKQQPHGREGGMWGRSQSLSLLLLGPENVVRCFTFLNRCLLFESLFDNLNLQPPSNGYNHHEVALTVPICVSVQGQIHSINHLCSDLQLYGLNKTKTYHQSKKQDCSPPQHRTSKQKKLI